MSIVSIHQPNYFPWLGYFYKIVNSDVFVFLDNVQFSKNSYINRVQIYGKDEKVRWLTVPVSVHLGQLIEEVHPSSIDWRSKHLDIILMQIILNMFGQTSKKYLVQLIRTIVFHR